MPNATLSAVRAIISQLLKRYIFRFSLIFSILFTAIFTLSLILAVTKSTWWLLLACLFLLPILVSVIITLISWHIAKKITPRPLTKSEHHKIKLFVDEFGIKAVAAKGVRKNPTALSGIIVWKYIKGRGKQPITDIITEPIKDVKSLKSQFIEITKLF